MEEKIDKLKSNCLSMETPCQKCIEILKCKRRISDVKKITAFEQMFTRKFCPKDRSCGCKKIGLTKAKITRLKKKVTNELDVVKNQDLLNLIHENQKDLNVLEKKCVKTIHDKKRLQM